MLHNYVISIRTSLNRRQHIINEFSKYNIPFSFYDAITPSIELTELIQSVAPNLNRVTHMTDGEKSCLMSHIMLWKKCVDEEWPYIAIFEDDIWLGKQANIILNESKWLDDLFLLYKNFVIKIETTLQLCQVDTIDYKLPNSNHSLMKLCSDHYGGVGYILSRQSAAFLLKKIREIEAENFIAVDGLLFDHLLASKNLSIFQLYPAICIQEIIIRPEDTLLSSQLESDRKLKKNNKMNRNLKQKILRELWRVNKKLHLFKYRNIPMDIIPFE